MSTQRPPATRRTRWRPRGVLIGLLIGLLVALLGPVAVGAPASSATTGCRTPVLQRAMPLHLRDGRDWTF